MRMEPAHTCVIILEKDLKSGLAGMRRGVPTSTSVPEDPSAASRSEKNTLKEKKWMELSGCGLK